MTTIAITGHYQIGLDHFFYLDELLFTAYHSVISTLFGKTPHLEPYVTPQTAATKL